MAVLAVQLARAAAAPPSPSASSESSASAIVVAKSWLSGLVSEPPHTPTQRSMSFSHSTGDPTQASASWSTSCMPFPNPIASCRCRLQIAYRKLPLMKETDPSACSLYPGPMSPDWPPSLLRMILQAWYTKGAASSSPEFATSRRNQESAASCKRPPV